MAKGREIAAPGKKARNSPSGAPEAGRGDRGQAERTAGRCRWYGDKRLLANKGEPDLRDWLAHLRERGAQVALPRVVEKGHPLRFLLWEEGARLERGVWNIPHPAEAVETRPDVALAPLVGFDHSRYRLGYGGGYFDRTLASTSPAPRAIGVGYREMEIETIFPLSHDIPMSEIVAV